MDDREKLDFFYEWAVWGHLSSKKDYELILLKGHLMLETALESTLSRNNIAQSDFSFYRKLSLLRNALPYKSTDCIITDALGEINSMRNKIAHEFFYEDLQHDLEKWSESIHNNLKGKKFTKFTARTKVVHAFSIVAVNLLKIKTSNHNASIPAGEVTGSITQKEI